MGGDDILIRRFDGNDFHLWKFQMSVILKAKGLMGIVNGTECKPDDMVQARIWQQKVDNAMMILVTSIDMEQVRTVVSCSTPCEVWSTLNQLNEGASHDNLHNLMTEFYCTKMAEDESVTVFVSRVKSLAHRLREHNEGPKDWQVVAKIVGSLNYRFKTFETFWKVKPLEERTLNNLMDALLAVEKEALNDGYVPVAYVAKKGASQTKRIRGGEYSNDDDKHKKCYECGKYGHIAKECRSREQRRTNFETATECEAMCAHSSHALSAYKYSSSGESWNVKVDDVMDEKERYELCIKGLCALHNYNCADRELCVERTRYSSM